MHHPTPIVDLRGATVEDLGVQRAQTVQLVESHERASTTLDDRQTAQAGRLHGEMHSLRLQLERTLTELQPVVGGTTVMVTRLDGQLCDARLQAQRAAEDIDQAAAMTVRAVGELQATSHKLLTRLAIQEERQHAAEIELRAAVRQFCVSTIAEQLEAVRVEAAELVRLVTAEVRYLSDKDPDAATNKHKGTQWQEWVRGREALAFLPAPFIGLWYN
ncbi:hypothetical protein T492DRAFT_1110422 [Pavlovales sp. CCMP2436]|nr:hypothetical protein T492DRAFT_1110422 [Pavlovales sp. CCMP2436]